MASCSSFLLGRLTMKLNITNPYGPNTTVLLPGDCNAHCDFCFWNREEANIPFDHTFSEKAFAQLERLPKDFKVLSVSGGEPTLSPEFTRFSMMLVARRKELQFERTVLTTHGGNLLRLLDVATAAYDHINISRHAIGYEDNVEVFKTDRIPTDSALRSLIAKVHKTSKTDVTLNCVVKPDVTAKFCKDFIAYAKDLGADAVSFRKYASDASPTKAELAFRKKYGTLSETQCPVCRGAVTQDEEGFQIRWKGSVMEPSIDTGGVYEAVLHPDAKLYTDWSRKVQFPLPKKATRAKKRQSRLVDTGSVGGSGSFGASCGSSSFGGGCGGGVGGGCGSGSSRC